MSDARTAFRGFLDAQGLKYGFAAEIDACTDKVQRGVANSVPPMDVWPRIVPTARVLERVRERFGATRVHSAYRSPAYNAAIDGTAKDSQHTHFRALDFSCATGTPAEWAAYVRELRRQGVFVGGIGTYRTFVHIDTRGVLADWVG